MKKLVLVCGALVAVVLVLAARWRDAPRVRGGRAGTEAAEEPLADRDRLALGPAEGARVPIAEEAADAAAAPPADRGPTLLELLAALADAEETALLRAQARGASGELADPELVGPVEQAVRALLEDPAHVGLVLALLVSGEARAGGAPGDPADWSSFGDVNRIEYAACRALYWAILLYNDPGDGANPYLGRIDGRAVVLDVVRALPRIPGGAQAYLLACVGEARYRATRLPVLDKTFLGDLLAMRPAFADDEGLFWELLSIVKESMTPEEIRALDGVLADPADPTAAREKVASLFQAGDHDLAVAVAAQMYAAASHEVREAIAGAVTAHADELVAANFLSERIEDSRNWPGMWFSLGMRERGPGAVDAVYASLLPGADASLDPAKAERARELCVTGMTGASDERLLEILDVEGSPRVRAQAFLTLTFRQGYVPSQEHLDRLDRGLRDGTIDESKALAAVQSFAQKAREDALREGAVSILERIHASTRSAHTRERAAAALQALGGAPR